MLTEASSETIHQHFYSCLFAVQKVHNTNFLHEQKQLRNLYCGFLCIAITFQWKLQVYLTIWRGLFCTEFTVAFSIPRQGVVLRQGKLSVQHPSCVIFSSAFLLTLLSFLCHARDAANCRCPVMHYKEHKACKTQSLLSHGSSPPEFRFSMVPFRLMYYGPEV